MRTVVEIELGGTLYRLVPGPIALLRVDRDVGDPMVLALALDISGKPPAMRDVFKVLRIALRESGYELADAEVDRLLFEHGLFNLYQPYAEFIGALCNAGVVPEGKKPANRAERRAAASVEKKVPRKASTGRA